MTITINENTRIEILEEKHALETFQLIDNNRDFLKEWLPWVDGMDSVESFMGYIRACKKQEAEGTDYGFVIFYQDKIVGRIGMHHIDRQNKIGEIGYWLVPEFNGKGIMISCCKKLIDYGFEEWQLNRIVIRCAAGNLKSKAIPERLGFVQEGLIRQGEFLNDGFVDLYLFGMLKREWK